MEAISYADVADNLDATFNRVCEDHSPVVVTRERAAAVVILSLEDFRALEETAYLSRSPANARRLGEPIETLERGAGTVQNLELSK